MTLCKRRIAHLVISILAPVWLLLGFVALFTFRSRRKARCRTILPSRCKIGRTRRFCRGARAIQRGAVDEKSMREMVERLWLVVRATHSPHGTILSVAPVCGRDQIVIRLTDLANASGGKLQLWSTNSRLPAPAQTISRPTWKTCTRYCLVRSHAVEDGIHHFRAF